MIWAFTPYRINGGQLVGESYDDGQTKAELADAFQKLGLAWVWQPVVAGSLDAVISQIAAYGKKTSPVVLNLCDGDDVNGYPGVSVTWALEASGIAFTGAESGFYELSTSKVRTKRALMKARVATAPFEVLPQSGPVDGVSERLGTPLFLKPSVSAAGWGLSLRSVVLDDGAVEACRDELTRGAMAEYFANDALFVERFLEGPEFTVFVGGYADHPESVWTLPAVERVFDPSIPQRERILCNERLGRPFYEYRGCPTALAEPLRDLAVRAYCAVEGSGYGRVDIRADSASGELFVLEVNANPGISGDVDISSVGCILPLAGMDFPELIGILIEQAKSRASRLSRAQPA